MRYFIIVFFILFSFLEASIIKKVEYISTPDKKVSIESIKNSDKFQKMELPFFKEPTDDDVFVKITLDKTKMFKKNYVIELLEYDTLFNKIVFDKNIEHDEFYLVKHIIVNSKTTPDQLYFKIINNENDIDFGLKVHNKKEYDNTNNTLTKLFGISYGIIFASFLFYFAFYIFNKEKMYIYYAITQISILIILYFSSCERNLNNELYFEFTFLIFLVSFTLFSREFLNTKKLSLLLDKLFIITIGILILDFVLITVFDIFEIIPSILMLSLYLIAGVLAFLKGQKEALFYLIGWGTIILSILIIDHHDFVDILGSLDPIVIFHFSSPLESLILAFALSYKMKLLNDERKRQEKLAIQQNKLASMGEMLANIAHQWRQPLTHLGYIMMNLEGRFEKDKLTKEYFSKKSKEATSQLEFMSNTIDNFKNFFKTDKQKEYILIDSVLKNSIDLLKGSLDTYNINIEMLSDEKIELLTYKGELTQVVFNILNNAKDQFIKKQIKDPNIKISYFKIDKNLHIKISDNAGGIDKDIIDKIFEPYFTTKENGLGIGLYMSKMIIEKSLDGKLEVSNKDDGVEFKMRISI